MLNSEKNKSLYDNKFEPSKFNDFYVINSNKSVILYSPMLTNQQVVKELIECINYLIDNAFVLYDNIVYHQTTGIPMGTNTGPQPADVYLSINMMSVNLKILFVFRTNCV